MIERIKAVSLWEPWASLMAIGAKKIETRSWHTSYRGPLLICAAKRRNLSELYHTGRGWPMWCYRDLGLDPYGLLSTRDLDAVLSYGKAVCTVELVDCRPTTELSVTDLERGFGDFSAGRYGWVTRGVVRLKPFPVKGKRGLFDVIWPAPEPAA